MCEVYVCVCVCMCVCAMMQLAVRSCEHALWHIKNSIRRLLCMPDGFDGAACLDSASKGVEDAVTVYLKKTVADYNLTRIYEVTLTYVIYSLHHSPLLFTHSFALLRYPLLLSPSPSSLLPSPFSSSFFPPPFALLLFSSSLLHLPSSLRPSLFLLSSSSLLPPPSPSVLPPVSLLPTHSPFSLLFPISPLPVFSVIFSVKQAFNDVYKLSYVTVFVAVWVVMATGGVISGVGHTVRLPSFGHMRQFGDIYSRLCSACLASCCTNAAILC
jgi:hypothetical protein